MSLTTKASHKAVARRPLAAAIRCDGDGAAATATATEAEAIPIEKCESQVLCHPDTGKFFVIPTPHKSSVIPIPGALLSLLFSYWLPLSSICLYAIPIRTHSLLFSFFRPSHTMLLHCAFVNAPAVLDINKIKELLPHRYPFLLVDRVIEYQPGVTAVGIKNVTVNDNFFPGHFPERPIMPGVLMVEAMAQLGGIVMLTDDFGGKRDAFFFAGVDGVRWRKPVTPGDTLVMRMTLTKYQKRFGIAKLAGKAYVGGDLVCEGEFMLALGS
ncbi:unnamed protein product [Closterium sp. NIES-53]